MNQANSTAHGSRRKRFDDRRSARLAWRVANRRVELTEAHIDLLSPDWQEAAIQADQYGPDGITDWLHRERRTMPADRVAAIEAALAEAKLAPDDEPDDATDDADDGGERIDFGIITSADFNRREYPREFIVDDVLVEGQPCVVGAPRKALKTTLCVELALCIAAAVWFLGRFNVRKAKRVLFLSGESGEATLQETARRIAEARGIDLDDLGDMLHWGFKLPKLGDPRHVEALAAYIRENGIEVVIVDPLYLCLLSGGRRIDPANLFDVGPLLALITETILGAGATPILIHHLRKNRDSPEAPPELEDLAYSGIQEFARQWIMIGRRMPYEPGTGEHKLWFTYGGSAGHSGAWSLDVSEGIVDSEFRGRKWETTLAPASQARQEAQEQASAQKAEKKAADDQARQEAAEKRLADNCAVAVGKLAGLQEKDGGKGQTLRAWRGALGWNSAKFNDVRDRLLAEGKVEGVEVVISFGKGHRTVEGFRLAGSDSTTGTNGTIGTPGPSPNHDPRPDTIGTDGGSPPLKGGSPVESQSVVGPKEDDRDGPIGTPGPSPNHGPSERPRMNACPEDGVPDEKPEPWDGGA